MKVMGLKPGRIREFMRVFRETYRNEAALERIWRLKSLLWLGVQWHLGLTWRPTRAEFRRRVRVCRKCPIWDRSVRRCSPHRGSVLGCGCYTPYVSQAEEHCWGYYALPGEGVGW